MVNERSIPPASLAQCNAGLCGFGHLVACDLIGMGDSDKLPNSGPDRCTYVEHRSFLFALWEELKLVNEVIFRRP
jgi:hypothetical protein